MPVTSQRSVLDRRDRFATGTRATGVPAHLLLGPPRHGVRLIARQLAGELQAPLPSTWEAAASHAHVHLHVNSSLLQDGATDPAAAVTRLARRTRVTLTLHDVPQVADGAAFERRRAVYRRLVRAVDGWAVSSHHEERLVHEHLDPTAPGLVAPLPVFPAGPAGRPPRPLLPHAVPLLGVLGFVYPGKGHREAIAAAARLRPEMALGVVALGEVAPGHDALAADLRASAARRGVPFHVTGHLEPQEMAGWMLEVDVAVCGHRSVSASGSTNSWIGSRRRPLVRNGRYAREMALLRPGTTRLYDAGDLPATVRAALARPETTWISDDVDTRPHLGDTAGRYRRWWGSA